MKKIQFILLTLVTSILVSCGTTSTVPVTGRKHRLSVSDEYVLSLSTQEYAKFMKSNYSANNKKTGMVFMASGEKTEEEKLPYGGLFKNFRKGNK